MMLAPTSTRSRGVIAFTEPCVPTGMKTGVSIVAMRGDELSAARGAVLMGEREHVHRQEASIIPPMAKLRVGVIYGGRSGEHEVSVASAASIIKHLDRTRYQPVPIRIEKDGAGRCRRSPRPRSPRRRSIDGARQQSHRRAGRDRAVTVMPAFPERTRC